MKTIILLSLGVLVLSMVLTTWAQDPTNPPEVPTPPPTELSGGSGDVNVTFDGDDVRVKRGACRYWFRWVVRGTPRLTGRQITASIKRFFATVVCR